MWRSMLSTGLVLYSQLRESGPHREWTAWRRGRPPHRCPQLRTAARRLAATRRARVDRGARRPGPPAGARRAAAAADARARGAGARGGPRRQPDDGRRRLRGAAGGRDPAQPARRGQLDTAAARDRGLRCEFALLPPRRPHPLRPRARLPRRSGDRAARGGGTGRRGPGRPPLRARVRPARPARTARGDRAPVHRTRPAHHRGPGAGHRRGAGRDRAGARRSHHARRPGARRAPDLPERARRRARPRRAVRPGAPRPRLRRSRRVGPGPA